MGVEAVEEAGIEVDLEGAALLTNPLLNKATPRLWWALCASGKSFLVASALLYSSIALSHSPLRERELPRLTWACG